MKTLVKAVCVVCAASLIFISPGLGCWQAAAQAFEGGAGGAEAEAPINAISVSEQSLDLTGQAGAAFTTTQALEDFTKTENLGEEAASGFAAAPLNKAAVSETAPVESPPANVNAAAAMKELFVKSADARQVAARPASVAGQSINKDIRSADGEDSRAATVKFQSAAIEANGGAALKDAAAIASEINTQGFNFLFTFSDGESAESDSYYSTITKKLISRFAFRRRGAIDALVGQVLNVSGMHHAHAYMPLLRTMAESDSNAGVRKDAKALLSVLETTSGQANVNPEPENAVAVLPPNGELPIQETIARHRAELMSIPGVADVVPYRSAFVRILFRDADSLVAAHDGNQIPLTLDGPNIHVIASVLQQRQPTKEESEKKNSVRQQARALLDRISPAGNEDQNAVSLKSLIDLARANSQDGSLQSMIVKSLTDAPIYGAAPNYQNGILRAAAAIADGSPFLYVKDAFTHRAITEMFNRGGQEFAANVAANISDVVTRAASWKLCEQVSTDLYLYFLRGFKYYNNNDWRLSDAVQAQLKRLDSIVRDRAMAEAGSPIPAAYFNVLNPIRFAGDVIGVIVNGPGGGLFTMLFLPVIFPVIFPVSYAVVALVQTFRFLRDQALYVMAVRTVGKRQPID